MARKIDFRKQCPKPGCGLMTKENLKKCICCGTTLKPIKRKVNQKKNGFMSPMIVKK
ncbi:MAG: hypothetical protein AABW67_03895 [Nanoarchaeota archaeon]